MTHLTLQNSQNLMQHHLAARRNASQIQGRFVVRSTQRLMHALARVLGSCKPVSRRAMEF
jgi:hypothetical protein